MKKTIFFIFIILLAFFINLPQRAYAGSSTVTISGPSTVEIGKSYGFNVVISANAASLGGSINVNGDATGNVGTYWVDSNTARNQKITAYGSIYIEVDEDAKVGDAITIVVSGTGVSIDSNTYDESEFSISKSMKVTIIEAVESTPTANPTRRPDNTPSLEDTTIEHLSTSEALDNEKDDLTDANMDNIWADIKGKIENEDDKSIDISFDSDYLVPVDIFVALKESNTSLSIDTPLYTCQIAGEDITNLDDMVQALSLDISFERDEKVSDVADNKDEYQLHFASQMLPMSLTYYINLKQNKPNDILYLYYYYPDSDVLEYVYATQVDNKSEVELKIYHFSSYVLSNDIIKSAYGNPSQILNTVRSASTKQLIVIGVIVILFVGSLYVFLICTLIKKKG